MKKIIFSIMAVAAIAACTKSEVEYTNLNEISIAPVASNVTKSVAGYNGNTFDGVFPTDIDLYVFANAVEGTYSSTNAGSPYFKNAQFEWKDGIGTTTEVENIGAPNNKTATAGAYAGNPTRYWPNVKTLVFAGYSDACGLSKTTPTMDFANNALTIPAYTQDNATYTTEGANDLMWFPCDGRAYSKQANEIVAQMKHACSWITINVAKHTNLSNIEYKLDQLELASFAHKGKVVCTKDGATWDELDNKTPEVYCKLTTDNTLSTTPTNFETNKNNFIVIPQTPVDLNVTYTYTSDSTNGLTLTETKPVSLKFNNDTAWQSGVHYIYNITITATEILIDPVVVAWTEYDYDNNTEGNQPIPVTVQ